MADVRPRTQKSFKLSMDFLYEGVRDRFAMQDRCVTLDADKGFVSFMWNSMSTYHRRVVQMANPLTHSVVEIPPIPPTLSVNNNFRRHSMPGVKCGWVVPLVVAEDYSAFTLYYVLGSNNDPERKTAFRFHSRVGEWREIPQPPRTLSPKYIVKLDLTLFTLFSDTKGYIKDAPQLLAFDTMSDTWSRTGVVLPHNILEARLATAQDRLFFFAFGLKIVDGGNMAILLEIDVASNNCSLVASLDLKRDFNGRFQPHKKTKDDMMVVGCGDFIVFSFTNGFVMAYNLVTSKGYEWMENRMMVYPTDINTDSTLADGDDGDAESCGEPCLILGHM